MADAPSILGRSVHSKVRVEVDISALTIPGALAPMFRSAVGWNLYSIDQTNAGKPKVKMCCPRHDDEVVSLKQTYNCPKCEGRFDEAQAARAVEVSKDVYRLVGSAADTKAEAASTIDKGAFNVTVRKFTDVARSLPGDLRYIALPSSASGDVAFDVMRGLVDDRGQIIGQDACLVGTLNVRGTRHDFRLVRWGDHLVFDEIVLPEYVRHIPEIGYVEASAATVTKIAALLGSVAQPYDAESVPDTDAHRYRTWLETRAKTEIKLETAEDNREVAVLDLAARSALLDELAAMLDGIEVPAVEAKPAPAKRKKATAKAS